MKNYYYFFLFILCLACKEAKPKYLPVLSPLDTVLMKFDFKSFEENKIDSINSEYTTDKGVYINQQKQKTGYSEKHIYPNNLIFDIFIFDTLGFIKIKFQIMEKLNFAVGEKLVYDEKGNIIERINRDKNYPFSLEDVLAFLKKENIDIENTYTNIYRYFLEPLPEPELNTEPRVEHEGETATLFTPPPMEYEPELIEFIGRHLWVIAYRVDDGRTREVYLDAKTGEILTEIYYPRKGQYHEYE